MKCEGCSAPCCQKFIKFVTIHDAARIMNTLKLDPLQFLDLRPAEIESEYPQVMLHNQPHLLALDSKIAKEDCVFLVEVGSARKCGIHAARPRACQTYPYVLNDDGSTLELSSSFVCPWQYWPKGEEKERYLNALRELKKEKEEYQQIVEAWNKEHGAGGNLLKFLEFAWKRIL